MKEVRRYDIEGFRREIDYDRKTGRFWWRGEPGTIASNGYRYIKVNQVLILAHRLAWMLHYGREADGLVDHINGDRLDNRIENLRIATYSQNSANAKRHSRNTSGLKGASKVLKNGKWTGRWQASITFRRKQTNLDYFDTREETHKAYLEAATKYQGEFANSGSASEISEPSFVKRDWLLVATPRYAA